MTIWKFELETTDTQTIEMPVDAQILCVQMQRAKACIWAVVNTENIKQLKTIEIFGTGHDFERARRKYIGTYQMLDSALVFHVFERL